jgi:hypothetical protein
MVAFFSYVGGESLNSEVYISKLNENEQPSKKPSPTGDGFCISLISLRT